MMNNPNKDISVSKVFYLYRPVLELVGVNRHYLENNLEREVPYVEQKGIYSMRSVQDKAY